MTGENLAFLLMLNCNSYHLLAFAMLINTGSPAMSGNINFSLLLEIFGKMNII